MPNFKPVFVEATTIGDAWFQLLSACYEKGRRYLITSGSHEGSYRLALDDAAGFIKYPHERPLAPIMPEGSNLPAPTDEESIEKYFVNYLMDSKLSPNEEYRYSTWLAGGSYKMPVITYNGSEREGPLTLEDVVTLRVPDQIQWCIDHFKKKGFGTEHCWIQLGYPESNHAYDIPYKNEIERRTSPCMRGLGLRIVEEEGRQYLFTKVVFRSWDLFGGFPENIGGVTLLNEYVANELGVDPGPISFTSPSLHCYEHHLEVLKLRLNK